jgi:hypothetical protein
MRDQICYYYNKSSIQQEGKSFHQQIRFKFNPLNAELNPICHLLTLLGAHHILHVSGVRVKEDTSEMLGARCWWRSWLRHCATCQKVVGSIPDGVIGIFY